MENQFQLPDSLKPKFEASTLNYSIDRALRTTSPVEFYVSLIDILTAADLMFSSTDHLQKVADRVELFIDPTSDHLLMIDAELDIVQDTMKMGAMLNAWLNSGEDFPEKSIYALKMFNKYRNSYLVVHTGTMDAIDTAMGDEIFMPYTPALMYLPLNFDETQFAGNVHFHRQHLFVIRQSDTGQTNFDTKMALTIAQAVATNAVTYFLLEGFDDEATEAFARLHASILGIEESKVTRHIFNADRDEDMTRLAGIVDLIYGVQQRGDDVYDPYKDGSYNPPQ